MGQLNRVCLSVMLTAVIAGCNGGSGNATLTSATQTPSSSTGFVLEKQVAVTTDTEGGSARPEIIASTDRIYVVYLGNISAGSGRTFSVKVYDANLDAVIATRTIVSASAQYGSPTDIRIASEGQSVYAFYETANAGGTYLWSAKYVLNDSFDLAASTATPIAASTQLANPPDGHEILNDPAPLIGPDSVYVVTRYDNSLTMAGKTVYHVREFDKSTLTQKSEFDLDLSSAADGRGRVTSLLLQNNSIYMALATTVSDQGVIEASDDSAASDIVLVKLKPDWTYDPATDVRTISSDQANDRENYISGLRTDGSAFYVTYKQTIPGSAGQTGEQRAVIKMFDGAFSLLQKEIVRSTSWPGGSEIRPSLEVFGSHVYSGEDMGTSLGAGNAEIFVYRKQ